jgi:anthranilate phosphoribosyltransferase
VRHHAVAGEALEHPFHLALHRTPFGLPLPSDEGAAIELERQEKGPRHRARNLARSEGPRQAAQLVVRIDRTPVLRVPFEPVARAGCAPAGTRATSPRNNVPNPLSAALQRLAAQQVLSVEETALAFGVLMAGEASPAQAAGFLLGLRARGETAAEVAGAARAIRAVMVPVPHVLRDALVDTCGTGGGRVPTLNLSTAAAFVVAAAGIPVAKHGNRSHTSRSGSADVLEALGVPPDQGPAMAAASIDRAGIAFLFAPAHHPAMRHLAPVRRELAVPTMMNLVGPLANPAGVRRQVVGVADPRHGPVVAEALRGLGAIHALVVHAEVGMDEVAPAAETLVWEVREDAVRQWRLDPARFGLAAGLEGLEGGEPADNARRIELLFGGEGSPALRAAVVLNAAAALYVAVDGGDLGGAVERAAGALDGGGALAKLGELRRFSTSG